MKTSTQLKALLRNLSKDKGISAEILLRNFMLERLLERISLSKYNPNISGEPNNEMFELISLMSFFDNVIDASNNNGSRSDGGGTTLSFSCENNPGRAKDKWYLAVLDDSNNDRFNWP